MEHSTKNPNPETRPFVLLVDDAERTLNRRLKLFEQTGFAAIGASSVNQAMEELRAWPSIDLLITDINLSPEDEHDKSGIALAKHFLEVRPDVPVVGYSGMFKPDELADEGIECFVSFHEKAGERTKTLSEELSSWFALASAHRRKKIERAELEVEELKRKASLDEFDVSILRSLLPVYLRPEMLQSVLSLAGYQLRSIEQKDLEELITDGSVFVTYPIPIWVRRGEESWTAELCRMPQLCGVGREEREAIHSLVLVLVGKYKELLSKPIKSQSPLESVMLAYLRLVFHGSID